RAVLDRAAPAPRLHFPAVQPDETAADRPSARRNRILRSRATADRDPGEAPVGPANARQTVSNMPFAESSVTYPQLAEGPCGILSNAQPNGHSYRLITELERAGKAPTNPWRTTGSSPRPSPSLA